MLLFRIRLFFVIYLSLVSIAEASIYCPSSRTLTCHDDFRNLSITGKATTTGFPAALIKYTDYQILNNCNVGTIYRTWYIDKNQDSYFQSSEPSCLQVITIISDRAPITVTFPMDRTYDCRAVIDEEKPSWTAGPCDVMGVQISDTKFDVNGESCYKIMRKYTVINWCDYTGQTGSPGIWTHIQKISVKDSNPPKIHDCIHKIYELGSDCKADVVLTNSASDNPSCRSMLLSWVAEVDLWANGTIDYKFGFSESGQFKLDPVADGSEISVKIPERLKPGIHKVKWSVRDQCGNFTSCTTTFETKDKKPPTPYIQDFITSAFQASGMPLMIPAKIFDSGSYDNCSVQKKLKFSFSPEINDTVRVVDCSNSGFQFFTIHVWDEVGNYEYIDVFMLVFDNGSCQGNRTLEGTITESNKTPVKNAKIFLTRIDTTIISTVSDRNGFFSWNKISVFDDYNIHAKYENIEDHRIDVADLKMLQDHIFGIRTLKDYEWIAADADKNKVIGVNDLKLIKDLIIASDKIDLPRWNIILPLDTLKKNQDILSSAKTSINIRELRNKLKFNAVYTGDISDANTLKSTSRNKIGLSSTINGNEVHFFANEDISASGLQIALRIPQNKDIIQVTSAIPGINQSHFYINKTTNEIILLNASDLTIHKNVPIVIIKFESSVGNLTPYMLPHSKILVDNYETKPLYQIFNDQNNPHISISPNPGHQIFKIISSDTSVISGVYDITGKRVQFVQDSESFEIIGDAGLYFVKLFSFGSYHTIKLIKF